MRRDLVVCGLLVALVLGLYGRTAGHEFVNYDVEDYVTANPHVRDGFTGAGVVWAFTGMRSANWHPLTWLSHMLDCELFGLEPAGHHLTSVALHALNAALLFLALRALSTKLPRSSFWPAAFVAATFAVHPLRVESVAWVAERKDVLSGLFFCLTLLAWARWVRRPSAGGYAAVVAAFALGLMAKPMLVTLPFVLLLFDAWPLGRLRAPGWRRLVVEKLPLFALSAASSVVTLFVQVAAGAASVGEALPLAARLLSALQAYLFYLERTVWPSGLAVFYPHPALAAPGQLGPLVARAVAGAAVVGGVTFAAWRGRRRAPWLAVGWLWFLGMLVPVIGLVQVGHQGWADRYAYLPVIGVVLMLAWSGEALAAARPAVRGGLAWAAGLALVGLSVVTWRQVGTWRDSVTLYRRALAVTEGNAVVHYNLGSTLAGTGALREAGRELERAVALDPGFYGAWFQLGEVLVRAGDVERAVAAYENGLRAAPDHGPSRKGLALALAQLGRDARARVELERVLAANPRDASAHHWLSILAWRGGDPVRAEEHCRSALELRPDYPEALANLGALLAERGDVRGAREALERALVLNPGLSEARRNLELLGGG